MIRIEDSSDDLIMRSRWNLRSLRGWMITKLGQSYMDTLIHTSLWYQWEYLRSPAKNLSLFAGYSIRLDALIYAARESQLQVE